MTDRRKPRSEDAIVADLHSLQRQEDALRSQKRGLDRELVERRKLDSLSSTDTETTVVQVGQG